MNIRVSILRSRDWKSSCKRSLLTRHYIVTALANFQVGKLLAINKLYFQWPVRRREQSCHHPYGLLVIFQTETLHQLKSSDKKFITAVRLEWLP